MKRSEVALIEVTNACNMGCRFCFGTATKMKVMREVFEEIDQLKGMKKIVFSGGEPLLNPNLMDMIQYAHCRGYETQLNTNGILLDDKFMKSVSGVLDWVNLPLDGTRETHEDMRGKGHYDVVMGKLDMLDGYKVKKSITCCLTKKNCHDVEALVKLAKEKNVARVRFIKFNVTVANKAYAKEYEIDYKVYDDLKKRYSSDVVVFQEE